MPEDGPDARGGRMFRLGTWNMNHWQTSTELRAEGWSWLRGGSGLDAALLQETEPPTGERVVYHEIAGRCPWGSAVVALGDGIEVEEVWSVAGGSRYRHRLAATYPGSVAVARVRVPGVTAITVVSVYNLLEGSPAANLVRVIADLIPLLDSAYGDRVIIGGDLNVYGAVAAGRRTRAGAIFRLLDDLGMHRVGSLEGVDRPAPAADCPCGTGGACGHIATWKGIDLDQVFVSSDLRSQVRSLAVERSVVDRGLSDHAALVVEMDLSDAPVARTWDAEAFIADVAARHGPGAASVVARLVDWAERKEGALRAGGIRDRQLTEYEIPRAIEPTMYVGLSFFDRHIKPQWLCAVHAASATLDISFQYMNHPPFDTEPGREPLRALLNLIPGVAIPASRLRGRPGLPLAALEDTAGLAQLLMVFELVVDATRPESAGRGGVDARSRNVPDERASALGSEGAAAEDAPPNASARG